MKDLATYWPVARVFFLVYGVFVGFGYGLLLNGAFSGNRLSGAVLSFALASAFALLGSRFRPTQRKAFWRDVAMLPLIPFALIAGMFSVAVLAMIFCAVAPFFVINQYWRSRQFTRAMMRQSRFIDLHQLREHLTNGEGTLLEETGTKGPYRIWWTADDVLEFGSPIDDPEVWLAVSYEGKQHAFNSYCVANYLDDSKGKALLTSIPPQDVTSGRISRLFPKVRRAEVIRSLPVDRTIDFA